MEFQAALDALGQRDLELRSRQPERFETDADFRREAYERLQTITAFIAVIEGSWDGDSRGWFIGLSAITEEPSPQHPRYKEHGLYSVREWDRMVELAVEFGTELADRAGVEFYLADANKMTPDEDRRWWNSSPGET